jgi:hypothetical protein
VNIRVIAEQLQADLVESPNQKPTKVQAGSELKFVRAFLNDWGYELPAKKIQTLAAKSKSYQMFLRAATRT